MGITRFVKQVIKKAIYFVSPVKCILFESVPDVSDNTKAVFEELLRRKYNEKYVLIWILYDPVNADYPAIKNVKYVSENSLAFKWWRLVCKCFISCNRIISATGNPGQFFIHVDHGSPFKDAREFQCLPLHYQYLLCASDKMLPYRKETFNIKDSSRLISLGYPRNDVFSEPAKDFHDLFGKSFAKLIVWMPTYRQNKYYKSNFLNMNALPALNDADKGIRLNAWAQKNNVLIVLKPHPVQDVSYIQDLNLSHIVFTNDAFLMNHNVSSYDLLNASDALLSDYSSVYYDYTLHDKPIGLIWEDVDLYISKRGLVPDYEFWTQGGVKIYSFDELLCFLDDVIQGKDILREERRNIRDCANYSTDGKNAMRVTDFIIEKAGLE